MREEQQLHLLIVAILQRIVFLSNLMVEVAEAFPRADEEVKDGERSERISGSVTIEGIRGQPDDEVEGRMFFFFGPFDDDRDVKVLLGSADIEGKDLTEIAMEVIEGLLFQ